MRTSPKLLMAITAFATLTAFTFTACNRLKNDDAEDTGYAADHATIEKNFADVQSIADEAGESGSLSTYRTAGGPYMLGQCANVTHDTVSTPHKITVDFGTTNCLCKDGVYRRGQIIITYTGRYRDLGHTHTISFNNYFVNDNQLTGTKTVTYNTTDVAGNPIYDITIDGHVILANSTDTISSSSTRTRTWIAGFNTPNRADDVYEISGGGTITRANGKTFSIQVTTPLQVALACRWIQSGVVTITPQGGTARTLDYGSGTCDAQATLTVNGKTHSITLR
jgi:hypothetical protein